MFWRVQAMLNFTTEDEAYDFYHDCTIALSKSQPINPGQYNEEVGFIALHECPHDSDLPRPCVTILSDSTPICDTE